MAETSILPAIWDIPQEFRDRLGSQAGRQRAMSHEGHLLLVLHGPPKPEETERRGRFFWRQPDGTWSSNAAGAGPNALHKHIDEFAEVIGRYDKLEEQAKTADEYFMVLEELAPIHRAAANMYQVLQDARKQVPNDRDLIDCRDQSYDVQRTADLLYNVAKNSLDFSVAKRAEEQAKASHQMSVSAHRLNVLAAFFFPLATLTAIFGTQLKTGLEDLDGPVPFLIVLGLGLVIGALLTSFVTRSRDDDS